VRARNSLPPARRVSETRLATGDVSGYANRRIRLESARYATIRAEALLARRSARLALASLIAPSADSLSVDFVLDDSPAPAAIDTTVGSLVDVALRARPDLRAAQLEAEAAAAEARLASRERIPVPTVSAGFKSEKVSGAEQRFDGFTLGLSIPLPLWDRRDGAVGAAEADTRRLRADVDASRRRIAREVLEAADALRATEEQLDALRGELGPESAAALHSVQVAYSEGEISLVEWLDAVRAYQEAESSYATLRAESLIRRAALVRAVGSPTVKEPQE
jgi:outer membrane protein, heavy metal efflux system